MKNGQTEKNQGFRLDFFARRRTKVRRVAKFVRSIKHKKFLQLMISNKIMGFCNLFDSAEPLDMCGFIRSSLFLQPLYFLYELFRAFFRVCFFKIK